MTNFNISVLGGGIVGIWQAYILAKRGHNVSLVEKTSEPFARSASLIAGAMLAPYCEEESAEPIIREMGLASLPKWQEVYPSVVQNGSLVLTQPRDRRELIRFARMTEGHEEIDAKRLADLEPDLAERYGTGLYFPQEAHMAPRAAMQHMLDLAQAKGVDIHLGQTEPRPDADYVIDCRGLEARAELQDLRGVRGEMVVVRSGEITLNRPVRLLHPRFPIYVVPWPDNEFMIGATVLESEERHTVTLRSALELLGTAYALHPGFGEAELIGFHADVRPAFSDNLPRIVLKGSHIYVNGLYRHGFLTAPALADYVATYLATGQRQEEIFVENYTERRNG